MNRGGVGARSLNIELQAALNPAGERKVERFGWTFAPGDKVMQVRNNYDKDVYNGDIGVIASVDGDGLVVYQLKRPFSDGTTMGLPGSWVMSVRSAAGAVACISSQRRSSSRRDQK